MKKILALFLSLALVFSLAACESSSASSDTQSASVSSYDEAEEGETSDTTTAENEDTATADAQQEVTFEELVVVDNDECVIKLTGIDPDNMWGYTVNAELENKSSEKTYMFSVVSASVNGVASDPLFASEVAAGKKANEEISFSDSTLEENGVVDYTDIALTFRVYNSDDWSEDDVAYETVHVYPYGEENAIAFVRESLDTDTLIVDNDEVSVIVTGYEYDDIWGYTVNLYLENKTETEVMFSVNDASVNGYMIDPFYAESVPAGCCAFGSMSWYEDELEENGISEVEAIEFQLTAYDNEDWAGDYFVDETVTLNP
ncbi:MAG: hypothetical protein LUD78_09665 [Clostridiales bacterium]|nr:hypothetical protein [Clostridiales bacterium]